MITEKKFKENWYGTKIPEVCKTCRCFDNRKFPKAYSCADIFMDVLCMPHLDGSEPLYPPLPKPKTLRNKQSVLTHQSREAQP